MGLAELEAAGALEAHVADARRRFGDAPGPSGPSGPSFGSSAPAQSFAAFVPPRGHAADAWFSVAPGEIVAVAGGAGAGAAALIRAVAGADPHHGDAMFFVPSTSVGLGALEEPNAATSGTAAQSDTDTRSGVGSASSSMRAASCDPASKNAASSASKRSESPETDAAST